MILKNTSQAEHMKTMDVIDRVAEATGNSKADAKTAVETVISTIVEAAIRGEEINLHGLGKFVVKTRPARQGRNPATGESIMIPTSHSLRFTQGKTLKDALNP
ncbi:HU family DNA-binding protein [Acetobacter indonesiensis]|nr:histone-like DNA-binding protein HU [Gluconobacter japonicus NBRC 3271]